MKVIINIIKFIAIAILAICLIYIGIKSTVSSTIFNKEYVLEKLEETNFYEETYKIVKSNFENYIHQSGLDEIVLEDICSKDKVEKDIKIIISNIYEGKNEKIDTTEISKKLNENIDKQNVRNSKTQKPIEKFVEQICNEYTDTILHTQYEEKINQGLDKITEYLNKVNILAIAIMIIDIVILITLNIGNIAKLLQNVGMALLTTSAFEIIAINIIKSKVNIAGIKVFNDSFSETLVTILQDIIGKIMSLGITTLLLAIAIIAIYAIIVFCKTPKNKESEKTN